MKKVKSMLDKQYKKELEAFQQLINPKPNKRERERLRRKYLESRK